MIIWKKFIVISLVVALVFSVYSPALASENLVPLTSTSTNMAVESLNNYSTEEKQVLLNEINNPELNNLTDIDPNAQNLAIQATLYPDSNLISADLINGEKALVYKTSEPDTQIAITDGHIDVIKINGGNSFEINGVAENIVFNSDDETVNEDGTLTETPATLPGYTPPRDQFPTTDSRLITSYYNYSVISNPYGSWKLVHAKSYNLYFRNKIGNYKAATLTALLGLAFSGVGGAAFGFLAGQFLSSPYTNSSTARAYIKHYTHVKYPALYKSSSTIGYALNYSNRYVYLDTKRTFFIKNFCGVC